MIERVVATRQPNVVKGLLATATILAAATASLIAIDCGGNDFTAGSSEGGSEGGSGDAGATDAADGASGLAGFCQALTGYYARCGYAAPCDQKNLEDCAALGFSLSDATRQAFIDCQATVECLRGTDFVRGSCVRSKLAMASLTPVQSKYASDFCAACHPDAGTCMSAFYAEGAVAGTDGLGFVAFLLNDPSVSALDKACIPIPGNPDAGACDFRFGLCEVLNLPSLGLPADACKDGGFW